MKMILSAALFALTASAVAAAQHPGHATDVQIAPAQDSEDAAVRAVLTRYKNAIERLDATGTEHLFTVDATIFETGGVEGTYANYLAHHLGPELKAFKAFAFSDYKADVRFEGPIALANESYNYRIETKTGEIAERRGVATSVLKRIGGQWRILSMHNSARRPKGA